MNNQLLLSIVIPCYNSQDTITDVVELTIKELSNMQIANFEFILVNDSSKDITWPQRIFSEKRT